VLLVLYLSVGQLAGICWGINEAKVNAETAVMGGDLTELFFSDADITSGLAVFHGSREVLYRGYLYDIASINKRDSNYSLKVYHDEKEETLIGCLKEVFDSLLSSHSDRGKHTIVKMGIQDCITSARFIYAAPMARGNLSRTSDKFGVAVPILSIPDSPPRQV
jgi:hypothetical protein